MEGTKKDHFTGVVQLQVPGHTYRSEREDYKKLDDLINHLFDHVKEQMSKDSKRGVTEDVSVAEIA